MADKVAYICLVGGHRQSPPKLLPATPQHAFSCLLVLFCMHASSRHSDPSHPPDIQQSTEQPALPITLHPPSIRNASVLCLSAVQATRAPPCWAPEMHQLDMEAQTQSLPMSLYRHQPPALPFKTLT